MFSKLIQWYLSKRHKGGFTPNTQDHRDYILGWWGAEKDYTPKKVRTNNAKKLLEIKSQTPLNTCVLESGLGIKEVDENCLLDIAWMAAYLRSKGLMSSNGTSLSYFHKALLDVGVPALKKALDRSVGWLKFSDPKQLTQESFNEAALHKIKSFYKTYSLNKVLEEMDNGRMGHSGADWYTGYNSSGLGISEMLGVTNTSWWKKILFRLHFGAKVLGGVALYIITLNKGYLVGGHAFITADYDTDYHGYKVVVCVNSYSKLYGDNGKFYVKWADFNKLCKYGVYFNTDLDKDVVGWLSINAGQFVKEKDGPKIYLIQSDKKRHIPNEAVFEMMRVANNKSRFLIDDENMLPEIQEGVPISFEEIPEWAKEVVKSMLHYSNYPQWTKEAFKPYFPELWS